MSCLDHWRPLENCALNQSAWFMRWAPTNQQIVALEYVFAFVWLWLASKAHHANNGPSSRSSIIHQSFVKRFAWSHADWKTVKMHLLINSSWLRRSSVRHALMHVAGVAPTSVEAKERANRQKENSSLFAKRSRECTIRAFCVYPFTPLCSFSSCPKWHMG